VDGCAVFMLSPALRVPVVWPFLMREREMICVVKEVFLSFPSRPLSLLPAFLLPSCLPCSHTEFSRVLSPTLSALCWEADPPGACVPISCRQRRAAPDRPGAEELQRTRAGCRHIPQGSSGQPWLRPAQGASHLASRHLLQLS
jgi:hypothetical protein